MRKPTALPDHKTRIVATIGPASALPEVMDELLRAGMDVARVNFSHGDFDGHARVIAGLRASAARTGCRLAIMADLPGPKMRIGLIAGEPVELHRGEKFTLTTRETVELFNTLGIDFKNVAQSDFDSPLGLSSGAGAIFGTGFAPFRGGPLHYAASV